MSFLQLSYLGTALTFIFWWIQLQHSILLVIWESLLVVFIAIFLTNKQNKTLKRFIDLNTYYVYFPFSLLFLRKLISVYFQWDMSIILRITAWLTSTFINKPLLTDHKLYVFSRPADSEDLIMSFIAIWSTRIAYHFRYKDPFILFYCIFSFALLGSAILHLFVYKNGKRLMNRPFMILIWTLRLWTLVWNIMHLLVITMSNQGNQDAQYATRAPPKQYTLIK